MVKALETDFFQMKVDEGWRNLLLVLGWRFLFQYSNEAPCASYGVCSRKVRSLKSHSYFVTNVWFGRVVSVAFLLGELADFQVIVGNHIVYSGRSR